jgi:hypothetical protein
MQILSSYRVSPVPHMVPPLCLPRDNSYCDKELSLFFVPQLARYEPPTTRYEPLIVLSWRHECHKEPSDKPL